MEIGSFNQKASGGLVAFVFACIITIITILYFDHKSTVEALDLQYSYNQSILNELNK